MQGSQGPPGISEFAHVTSDAQLEFGTALSAEKNQFDTYVVTFGRDLSGCVAVASQGTANGGGFHTKARLRAVIVDDPFQEPTKVFVAFNDVDTGAIVFTDFHLIVVC